MERPSWDRYFLDLMHEVSKRATCDRGRSGALVVQDKRIVSTGYVAPNQRLLISQFGLKALLAGTLASLMSATIIGMILG